MRMPAKVKDRLHRLVAPLVYSGWMAVIPARMQPMWPERRFLKSMLHDLEIDCVIDAGANVGQFGADLRALGFAGTILSFEPDPDCFVALREHAAADRSWHVFNLALGTTDGELPLNRTDNPVYNSFLAPEGQRARWEAGSQVREQIIVRMVRLDEFLLREHPELLASRVHLKMDTQGFDLQVFRGAQALLPKIATLQTELAFKQIYLGMPCWQEVVDEIGRSGFEMAAMFAVNPHRKRVAEMDCFMQRAQDG